jgi:hypothetical protein
MSDKSGRTSMANIFLLALSVGAGIAIGVVVYTALISPRLP